MKYRTIVADPPWDFGKQQFRGGHYIIATQREAAS